MHYVLTGAAVYRGRGRGLGILFQYLFRWLYSVIGPWAWVVLVVFTGLCLGLSAWAGKGRG